MNFLKSIAHASNALVLTVMAMSITCAVLVSILFYLMMPSIEIRRDKENAQMIVDKIISTTSADAVIYWDIRLETNSRAPLAWGTRRAAELPHLEKYIKTVQDLKLTAGVGVEELQSLLAGNVHCHDALTRSAQNAEIAKNFITANPTTFICINPIANHAQMLVGQLNIVWREHPPQEALNSALIQTKGLLQTKIN